MQTTKEIFRTATISVVLLGLMIFSFTKLSKQSGYDKQEPHAAVGIPNANEVVANYSIRSCSCIRHGFKPTKRPSEQSTCSDFSTQRGNGQMVFSYTWYTPEQIMEKRATIFRKYFGMMYDRAQFIQTNFPGWLIRIYHNVSEEDGPINQQMCRIFCDFDLVDFCDVTNLPNLGNFPKVQPIGRLWRFLVMGDPTVRVFLIRDTDSYILRREVTAVREWLDSKKEFHVMRDHPYHRAVMLAGLWGGWNSRAEDLRKLRNMMLHTKPNYYKKFDQFLLQKYLWPFVQTSLLQHDSYNCKMKSHSNSVPFNTKREDYLYVGWGPYKVKERKWLMRSKCPIGCRPKAHQNWSHC